MQGDKEKSEGGVRILEAHGGTLQRWRTKEIGRLGLITNGRAEERWP